MYKEEQTDLLHPNKLENLTKNKARDKPRDKMREKAGNKVRDKVRNKTKTQCTRYLTTLDKTLILVSYYLNIQLFIMTYNIERKTSRSTTLKRK